MAAQMLDRLISQLGEEDAFMLITTFPNVRLPGIKAIRRYQKRKFLREYTYLNHLSLADLAKKYGVTPRTVYGWQREMFVVMKRTAEQSDGKKMLHGAETADRYRERKSTWGERRTYETSQDRRICS